MRCWRCDIARSRKIRRDFYLVICMCLPVLWVSPTKRRDKIWSWFCLILFLNFSYIKKSVKLARIFINEQINQSSRRRCFVATLVWGKKWAVRANSNFSHFITFTYLTFALTATIPPSLRKKSLCVESIASMSRFWVHGRPPCQGRTGWGSKTSYIVSVIAFALGEPALRPSLLPFLAFMVSGQGGKLTDIYNPRLRESWLQWWWHR